MDLDSCAKIRRSGTCQTRSASRDRVCSVSCRVTLQWPVEWTTRGTRFMFIEDCGSDACVSMRGADWGVLICVETNLLAGEAIVR